MFDVPNDNYSLDLEEIQKVLKELVQWIKTKIEEVSKENLLFYSDKLKVYQNED